MQVSELANRAGTTPKTIRFYEAAGVLPSGFQNPRGWVGDSAAEMMRMTPSTRLGLRPNEAHP